MLSIRLAAIVLSVIRPPVSTPRRLSVDIVFDGQPMRPRLEAAAMTEVTAIWARYGVDVRTAHADEPGRDGAVRLAVKLVDGPAGSTVVETLGSIRFVDAVPEPTIAIYPHAIASLVSTVSFAGLVGDKWPTGLRDSILGRVTGRALAHELGHYLLRSRHHSPQGLMRAEPFLRDFVSVDGRAFFLSAEDAALVSSWQANESSG
jgi:hypothetical protein